MKSKIRKLAKSALFTLYFFILAVIAATIDISLGNEEVMIVSAIVVIPHYIPSLALSARRLHDIGRSGWWQLLGIIPLVQLVLLFFWCKPSSPGENRFGPNPHSDTGSPQSATDPLGQIEKLSALRDTGAIDEDEFQQLKAEAISKSL